MYQTTFNQHRHMRRAPAWLALLSMLMLYLAPVGAQLNAASFSAAGFADTALCHVAAVSGAEQRYTHTDVPTAGVHDACGYCTLLAHLSGLLDELPFAGAVRGAVVAPECPSCWQSPSCRCCSHANPRAPPAAGSSI
ncbi:DUF2946 domain-containing protein [Pokkaliibacter plantistimulans]|nr:DUF2946 domain-containing protein [Pokkaliibacter plantistimulans]